jgi:hypothetical protein
MEINTKDLLAMIGQQKIEIDFLKVNLEQAVKKLSEYEESHEQNKQDKEDSE